MTVSFADWVHDLKSVPEEEQTAWIFRTLRSKKMLHVFALYFFSHMFPNPKIPDCHLDLVREISAQKDSAIIFPRGFGKSTWVKIDTIHDIVYALEPVILYIGATLGDASVHFEAIKAQLESNELLIAVYGELVPPESLLGRKWTNTHFETTNGVNVVARGRVKGRGVNIKDHRPTKAIIDDAEDDEMVRSPVRRAQFHEWLYSVIFPSLDKERSKIKMIGTVLHEFAEVLQFYEKHGGIFRKAIENGKSIWEERYPLHELDAIRQKLGTRIFNREYLNDAKNMSESTLNPSFIQKGIYTVPPPDKYHAFVYIDPQAGESSMADEYCITVLYASKTTPHRFVIEYQNGRESQLEQAKNVVRAWLRHKELTLRVGVEKVMTQTSVYQTIADWKAHKLDFNTPNMTEQDAEWIDERDRNIPLVACSPKGKDKVARLQVFEPDFERGEIHLRQDMNVLIEQLTFLGGNILDHDDVADSLIGALELCGNRKSLNADAEKNALMPKTRYNTTVMGNIRTKIF